MKKFLLFILVAVSTVVLAQDLNRRVPGPVQPLPSTGGGATSAGDLNYTPATPSDWDVVPTKADGALDELAGRTEALENAPAATYALDDLTDVDSSAATDGQVLSYDSGSSTWVPVDQSSGITWATPVDSDIVADTNNAYDLGSAASFFSEGFITFLHTGSLEVSDGTNSMTMNIIGGDMQVSTHGLHYVLSAAGNISHTSDNFTVNVDDDLTGGEFEVNGNAGSVLDVNVDSVDFTDVTDFDLTGVNVIGLPSSATALDDLTDVDLTVAPTDGQALIYENSSSSWKAFDVVSAINDLSDVDTSGVSDGQVLAYDSGTSTWLPTTAASGGDAWGDPVDADIVPNNTTRNMGSLAFPFNLMRIKQIALFDSALASRGVLRGNASGGIHGVGVELESVGSLTLNASSSDFFVHADNVDFTNSNSVDFTGVTVNGLPAGVSALNDLSDVTLTLPQAGQQLVHNGSEWINQYVGGQGNSPIVSNGGSVGFQYGVETYFVTGDGGAVTLGDACMSLPSPTSGAHRVTIMGMSDTDTVTVNNADVANGCILNGTAVLARFKSIDLVWVSSEERWVETARNF